MTTTLEYQQQMAKALRDTVRVPDGVSSILMPQQAKPRGAGEVGPPGVGFNVGEPSGGGAASGGVSPVPAATVLDQLINALPYYGSVEWLHAHRGALVNVLAYTCPNDAIIAQPEDSAQGYDDTYSYTGPFAGYRDAFFPGLVPGPAEAAIVTTIPKSGNPPDAPAGYGHTTMPPATTMMQWMQQFPLQLIRMADGIWWSTFSTAVLTDAIRIKTGLALDGNKLTAALSSWHTTLLPFLTQTYVIVMQTAYAPTAGLLQPVLSAGRGTDLAAALAAAVVDKQWNANINYSIAQGGDSTNAAVFFLYNIWALIRALDYKYDVDGCIGKAMEAGLNVPVEVQPQRWWNGGYSAYFTPLKGDDLAGMIRNTDVPMPENDHSLVTFSGFESPGWSESDTAKSVPNGYGMSFCYWSKHNFYKV